MKRYIKTAVAAACVGGAATGASASVITGTTYQVEQTGAFDVSFVSQSAGWTGSLYFTGAEVGGIMHPADDSDQYGIGQFLFDNHGTAPGHTVSIGEFEQGTVLHFAYQVFRGNKSNGNIRYVLRTDSPNDLNQFGWKEITPVADSMRTSTLHIEDIVGSGSDYDYNDVRANVIARAVPTPGTATLAGFALIVGCSRRRPKRA
ncbi:MAG: hypothetical protein ACFHWZ_10405 [Phycisphaerales bacterium]|nr:hypothetical protein [bacterium]